MKTGSRRAFGFASGLVQIVMLFPPRDRVHLHASQLLPSKSSTSAALGLMVVASIDSLIVRTITRSPASLAYEGCKSLTESKYVIKRALIGDKVDCCQGAH